MRTNGALLSLLLLSSACVGRAFADGTAGGGGGGGEDTRPQHPSGIQTQHVDEAEPAGVPPADSPTHLERIRDASASRTVTTNTDTDTDACPAADGSSCSGTAVASTTTASNPPGNDQQQQQQQQQEPGGDEGGAVKVETGEHDGVRIEFVGRTEGTIPEPERPAAPSSARDAGAAGQAPAAAAAEMKFELLRCDGESHRDGTEGGLTVKGIWNNLRSKLESSWEESAQWIAPTANATPGEGGAARTAENASGGGGTDGGGGGSGSSTGSSALGQALAVATAPASFLFQTLGRMPGWFSDAVFEASREDDSSSSVQLQDHLVLVQNRPRFAEVACSILAPFTLPPTDSATGSSTSSYPPSIEVGMRLLPRLVRRLCSADAPFPGKVVSRPCASAQQQRQQPQGWFSGLVEKSLSAVGFGGAGGSGSGALAGVGGEESGGVCVCRGGGGGGDKCTIRAPPGRDPCLYVEVAAGSLGKRNGGSGLDADSVVASSSVELRTYNVATATSTTAAAPGGLAALHAAAAERGLLPSSVAVPVYAAMLMTGAVLLLLAQPLSESRVFHYVLSALLGGGLLAAALVLPAVRNPRRGFLRLLLVFGLATWFIVAAGIDVVPSPTTLIANLPAAMLAFWSDGFTSCEWAGKASLAAAGLAGVVITRWQGLFLDDEDRPRGTWFNGRGCIRRALSISGISLVYHGVSDTDVGVALVMLSLATPTLAHYVRRYNMWSNSSKWYRAGNRLSQEEYEAQGDEYTRQAIAALRESTVDDWSVVKKLKNQASRRRMTLFVQSGEHFVDQAEPEDTGNGWTCTVQ
eukprot:g9318.t1